jgi:hypothetical protein
VVGLCAGSFGQAPLQLVRRRASFLLQPTASGWCEVEKAGRLYSSERQHMAELVGRPYSFERRWLRHMVPWSDGGADTGTRRRDEVWAVSGQAAVAVGGRQRQ